MRKIYVLAAMLLAETAFADVTYYNQSTIPPIAPANTIPCNGAGTGGAWSSCTQLPSGFVPVDQRAPRYTDDTTKGYGIGNYWTAPSGMYLANQVTANKAAWQAQGTALPLDQVGNPVTAATISAAGSGYAVGNTITMPNGTVLTVATISGSAVATVTITTPGSWGCLTPSNPVAQSSSSGSGTGATFTLTVTTAGVAFGTKLLTNCYTGNAMILTLVNGPTTTTKTLTFVNGVVDYVTGNAFCAPSPSTCYVTTWYDQSGNGWNATQSAGSSAPVWSAANLVNGFPVVVFNSLAHTTVNYTAASRYLTISSSFGWTLTSSTWVYAGLNLLSGEAREVLQAGSNTLFSSYNSLPTGNMAVGGVGLISSSVTPTTPSVTVYQMTSSIFNTTANNISHTHAGASVSSTTGGNIGTSDTSNPSTFDSLAVIGYTRAMSATDLANIKLGLYNLFKIAPQYNDVVFIDGDSMSQGQGSVLDNSFPRIGVAQLPRNVTAFNFATFGQLLSYLNTNAATRLGQVYSSSYRTFIVHILAGANDIRASVSVPTIEGYLQAYINTVHGLGPNAKVIVGTQPLQCDIFQSTPENAALQAYNSYIIANWNVPQSSGGLGADGLADYFDDPTIGQGNYTGSAFCGFPNVYTFDGGHPTDYTMSFMAPVFANAVGALVQ